MDLTKARWRFETVSDDYGIRVSLINPATVSPETPPISAVIGTGWSPTTIANTLHMLSSMYEELPEPEVSE